MHAPRAKEFLGQIPSLTHDLPCSIELLQKLSSMIYDHSIASAEEIGALIGRDQSFAAKALALANSPFYGLQRKISTIGRAVAVLGVREIRNMIFIIHYKRLATMLQPELLDMNAFLDHNLRVAEKAKALSEVAGKGVPEELYTAGLLHDIGKVLTALHRPEDWRRIVLGRKAREMWAAEAAYWGIDHGTIGAMAMEAWKLPPVLVEPVRFHHCPEQAGAYREMAVMLSVAGSLVSGHVPSGTTEKLLLEELGVDQRILRQVMVSGVSVGRRDPSLLH
jgi:putative nucleotidyltransferase with HDIG domain